MFALANALAHNESVRPVLATCAIEQLIALLRDESCADTAREQAARCLRYIARDRESHAALRAGGAIAAMAEGMVSEGSSTQCQENCLEGIRSLAEDVGNVEALLEGSSVVQALVQVMCREDEMGLSLDDKAEAVLWQLVNQATALGSAQPLVMLLVNARRLTGEQVAKALCSVLEQGVEDVVTAGVVNPLVELMADEDASTGAREAAVRCLAKLSWKEACVKEISRTDVVAALVAVLEDEQASGTTALPLLLLSCCRKWLQHFCCCCCRCRCHRPCVCLLASAVCCLSPIGTSEYGSTGEDGCCAHPSCTLGRTGCLLTVAQCRLPF